MSVWLSHEALSIDAAVAAVTHPGAGAVATFLGLVRDTNEGRAVTRLDYSAYEAMALTEMKRIVEEIEAERPGVRVSVAHRLGELSVGDAAVVCAASSKHRGDAFWASREAIDRIKANVPIWKREHGPHGADWVGWVDARCTPEGHGHAHAHADARATSPGHAGHDHTSDRRAESSHAGHAHAHAHAHAEASSRARELRLARAKSVRVVTITVSDTRTSADDTSGKVLVEELAAFFCVRHAIVKDDIDAIRREISHAIAADRAQAVVLTGGTGVAPRDSTYEAVTPLFTKTLDGFGEAFRRLSWDEIGARAVLSRATAGVVGDAIVIALPGSSNAVRLGTKQLVAEILVHATELVRGAAGGA